TLLAAERPRLGRGGSLGLRRRGGRGGRLLLLRAGGRERGDDEQQGGGQAVSGETPMHVCPRWLWTGPINVPAFALENTPFLAASSRWPRRRSLAGRLHRARRLEVGAGPPIEDIDEPGDAGIARQFVVLEP